ncbi:protein kinase domain-containing protein [Pseudarthrobacter sp. Y6]|uniref:protein kinase domain-containing protein n=1 Tax=Pseudarthrobacter sp. Y6 TaxID=3418422 RepID=UPI003CF263FF
MTARLDKARSISDVLAGLDDAGVRTLIDAAEPVGVGIGGTTKTACIDETTVFVKQLPLTSIEEADPTATASRVQLPFVCHYGIGSPTHGVGRELAAHQATSEWVQAGAVDFFPLLLGWRVVDLKCNTDLSEFDGYVPQRQWGTHWPQVRRKVTAMKDASKSVVLFLEYVPETLGAWVRRSLTAGTGPSVFADVIDQIVEATAWMRRQGFQHFDVHPGNILVQEGRLLFTDFGLALYRGFDLTPEEKESMVAHEGYDRDTALMHLFHWVLFELGYTSGPQRLALLRAAAADPATPALDPVRVALGSSADLIARHANVAVYITEMFGVLMQDASATRYNSTHDRNIQR